MAALEQERRRGKKPKEEAAVVRTESDNKLMSSASV